MIHRLVVHIVFLVAALLTGLGTPWAQGQALVGTVTRVIDGDTIEVQVGNHLEIVRYIGINTPEIHHPTRGREPYGEAAREANRRLVEGQMVRLVVDVQQRDRFRRLLADVYVDGEFINRELVCQGYAEVTTHPPNVRHRAEFAECQRVAREGKRGSWSDREALTHYRPRGSGVYANQRIRTFFHPDDEVRSLHPAYEYEFFESVDDARAAGYEPSLNFDLYAVRERERLTGINSATGVSGFGAGGTGSPGSWPAWANTPGTDVRVRGYFRGDGTYVNSYTRSAPGRGRR